MGQYSHGNRSVMGRHAAEFVAGDECRPRSQLCSTERGEHTGGSRANDDYVHYAPLVD